MNVRAGDCEAISGCRSCGSPRLETFLDLGAMPLSDGLRPADAMDEVDPRFPLEVAFCADCTLAQIRHTVAPEVLFADDYPYYSSFSDALIAHAKANVDARIDELGLGENDLAIEAREQRRLSAPTLRPRAVSTSWASIPPRGRSKPLGHGASRPGTRSSPRIWPKS